MSPIKILEDALAEGRSFADLAGKLRDKFKSGTADLQAIYDEAESVVDGAIAKARDGLAAFKAEVSKVEDQADGAAAGYKAPPSATLVVTSGAGGPGFSAPVTTTAPSGASVTVDPAAGTTTYVDGVASTTTTLDHASGTVTATDASGAVVEPAPTAVAEATQAAADAGVTVPAQG